MVFKQLAGLIARRVVSWEKTGEQVARGSALGWSIWVARRMWVRKGGDRGEWGKT